MRAELEPRAVVLKFPLYVPSASWIVSPGLAAVRADLSWAAVETEMTDEVEGLDEAEAEATGGT